LEKYTKNKIKIFLYVIVLLVLSFSLYVVDYTIAQERGKFEELLSKGISEFKKEPTEADFNAALKYLEEAESLNSENQEVHYFLGCAYEQLSAVKEGNVQKIDIEMLEKSSKHFEKVININPVYSGRTYFLDPYSKLTSVWGTIALNYIYKGDEEKAEKSFLRGKKAGAFFPAQLEYNKNVLISCESNAILFTNGDMDTFPVWYLQFIEGFRKDITVVNLGLLNQPWYIKFLKNPSVLCSNVVDFGMTEAEIDELAPIQWAADTVKIILPAGSQANSGILKWYVEPTIEDRGIRVQDMMIMKIIQMNHWKNTIYFALTVEDKNKIGLDSHLSLEGLVSRFYPRNIDPVSEDKIFQNCTELFTYTSINDENLKYSQNINYIYGNYRLAFIRAAIDYSNNANKEKAKECIEIMRRQIPESLVKYNNEKLKRQVEKFYNEIKD